MCLASKSMRKQRVAGSQAFVALLLSLRSNYSSPVLRSCVLNQPEQTQHLSSPRLFFLSPPSTAFPSSSPPPPPFEGMSLHRKALELLHDPSSDPSDPSLSEPDFLTQLTTPSNHQLRLFLSLNVLLVFLLIAYFAREDKKVGIAVKQKRRKGRTTVLLVGPLASGKTALFSKVRSVFSLLNLSRGGAHTRTAFAARVWSRTADTYIDEGERRCSQGKVGSRRV